MPRCSQQNHFHTFFLLFSTPFLLMLSNFLGPALLPHLGFIAPQSSFPCLHLPAPAVCRGSLSYQAVACVAFPTVYLAWHPVMPSLELFIISSEENKNSLLRGNWQSHFLPPLLKHNVDIIGIYNYKFTGICAERNRLDVYFHSSQKSHQICLNSFSLTEEVMESPALFVKWEAGDDPLSSGRSSQQTKQNMTQQDSVLMMTAFNEHW